MSTQVERDRLGNLELAIDERLLDLRREMLRVLGARVGAKTLRFVAVTLRISYMRGYEDHKQDRGALYRDHGYIRTRLR